jgi:feruloyl esterase
MIRRTLPVLLLFAVFIPLPDLSAAVPCETLSTLALPNTTITMAQVVEAGKFVAPPPPPRQGGGRGAAEGDPADNADGRGNAGAGGRGGGRGGRGGTPVNVYASLPAFCRVAATLKPTRDSDIKIEVWMPVAGWNNKMLSVGNGAWAGTISYNAMAAPVAAGYAATSTDTGHAGGQAATFIGNKEKVIDFSYRAVHEMSVAGKAITAAFYGGGPKLSYFQGCSTGGRQALTAAQRYPADFDGIIAGASAVNASRMHGSQIWAAAQANREPGSLIPNMPANKYALLHDAVLKACDALDGVTDRVLENPRQCKFDPAVLLCKDGDAATCLTAAQVETAKRVYAGTGVIYGYEYGSEGGWNGTLRAPIGIAYDSYRYLAMNNPDWDYKTFDPAKDIALFDRTAGPVMNSSDTNLKPFFDRGGKLLMYHGWADPGIPAANSVDYYTEVANGAGGAARASNSIRLFMLPGVGHCSGGDGPSSWDALGTIDQWRDKGIAPASIVASRTANGVLEKTRPLCPYPQTAQYKGTGSTNEAANFVCR